MWAAKPDEIKIPERSELLSYWCLPMLSRSLAADEKERDALQLYNAVKNMAAKQEGKTDGKCQC